jgi:hypothetical protein
LRFCWTPSTVAVPASRALVPMFDVSNRSSGRMSSRPIPSHRPASGFDDFRPTADVFVP